MDFKASKLSQLGYFLSHCPFKGGYFSSVDLKECACPFTGDYTCEVLVEKLPGPQFGFRFIWEMFAYRRLQM